MDQAIYIQIVGYEDRELLETLRQRWPEEIAVEEITEITCRSERAWQVIDALFSANSRRQIEKIEKIEISQDKDMFARETERLILQAYPQLAAIPPQELPAHEVPGLKTELQAEEERSPASSARPNAKNCLECGKEFIGSHPRSIYCSRRCRDRKNMRTYLAKKKAAGGDLREEEPAIHENLWLDELSGEILTIQEINQGLRKKQIDVGRMFRRSGNREYRVEDVQLITGKVRRKMVRLS